MANGTIAFDTLTTSDSVKSGTEKSIDTSYIYNGVAKSWTNINGGSGTPVIRDSFNHTTLTDNGTGDITHNFGNPMGNLNFVMTGFNIRNNDGGTGWCGGYGSDSEADIKNTTGATRIYHLNASNVPEDMRRAMVAVHGDLA